MRTLNTNADGSVDVVHDNGFVESFRPVGNGSPWWAQWKGTTLVGYIVPGYIGSSSDAENTPEYYGLRKITQSDFAAFVVARRHFGGYVPTAPNDLLFYADDFDANPLPATVDPKTLTVTSDATYVEPFTETQPAPIPVVHLVASDTTVPGHLSPNAVDNPTSGASNPAPWTGAAGGTGLPAVGDGAAATPQQTAAASASSGAGGSAVQPANAANTGPTFTLSTGPDPLLFALLAGGIMYALTRGSDG